MYLAQKKKKEKKKKEKKKGKQIGFLCFMKMQEGKKMVHVFHNVMFGTYKTEARLQNQDEVVGMMNDIMSWNNVIFFVCMVCMMSMVLSL